MVKRKSSTKSRPSKTPRGPKSRPRSKLKKRVMTRGFTRKPVSNKKKRNPTKRNIKKVRGFSNIRKRRKY